jgi:cytochrome c5
MNTELLKRVSFTFIAIATILFAGWVIMGGLKNVKERKDEISQIITAIDTAKYEEVTYVNARRFTSSNLYNLHCKMCHGNQGTGDGVVARFHADQYCPHDLSQLKKTDEEVYFVIVKGTEHMPDTSKAVSKHVLTNDDVWMVVYYIKKFKK